MWELSQEEYELWRSGAEVPASDQHGDKVLLLSDGGIVLKFHKIMEMPDTAFRTQERKNNESSNAQTTNM